MSGYALSNNICNYSLSPDTGMMAEKLDKIFSKFSSTSASSAIENISIYDDLQSLAEKNGKSIFNAPFNLAYKFVRALPTNCRSPEIDYDSDGEVTLDWLGNNRKMMVVSVSETGKLSYACRISATDKQYGTKLFIDTVPLDVLECIKKVV